MRRVGKRVPLGTCKQRAIDFGQGRVPLPASCFAEAIWPDAEFITSQGAGAAASRVLKALSREGRARWVCLRDKRGQPVAWGWEIV